MSARLPWIKRKWRFDFPVELFPDILERLRGTAARLEEMLRGVAADVLTRRDKPGAWSIQENVGHLREVEAIWLGRLEDYLADAKTLRPADMTNRATHDANYNAMPIGTVLSSFRTERDRFVARLDALQDADFARVAQHPRLETPMRLVDACLFAADHDDYHLARIWELLNQGK
ncbi:MAG: DinB family protein [Planctomycetota bacterium]